jgi:hypothetical protein
MKRLLLSLCLVGAVFSGHPRHVLETAQRPPTSINIVEARAVAPLPMPESLPQPPKSGVEQANVQSLAMTRESTQPNTVPRRDIQKAPSPTTPGESFEPSASPAPEGEDQEALWVVVIRGATVHSGPSVSAPTVRFYSVGTELQLIDHQHGWFQVLDPATSQRGWIYEKYYLQAIRGPGQKVAALQEAANPQQKVVNARKSPPHVRRAKKTKPRKIQPVIASAPRYRYETVASILDRAFRR